jgi:CDP-diglyceride synthetase
MNSLVFLTIGFTTSIIFFSMAIVIIVFTVIPLQFKEAFVKNGLQKLRKKLLIKGVAILLVAITSILALTGRFVVGVSEVARYYIVIMVVANATGILVLAVLDYLIYHEQYTPEAKKIHVLVDKLEKETRKGKTLSFGNPEK